MERQPLRFIDRELLPYLVDVTRRFSKYVGGNEKEIVLIPNVTTAINTVIDSYAKKMEKEGSNKWILTLDICYGSVKKIINSYKDLKNKQLNIQLPFTKEEIIKYIRNKIEEFKEEGIEFELAVFDHITSNTACLLPIKELTELAHEFGIKVFIDGAHALGLIEHLHLKELGVDFYCGNFHKWFFSPKGAAFLYVKEEYQYFIEALIKSHGYGSGFHSQFIWDGCRDYSSILTIPNCIWFWENILNRYDARGYIANLAVEVIELLSNAWGTKLLFEDPAVIVSNMFLFELPYSAWCTLPSLFPEEKCFQTGELNSTYAKAIQDQLFIKSNVEVPIKFIQSKLYVRVSIHVYNKLEDYRTLTSSMLSLWI